MYFSKYNIFSKIKESDKYFLMNLLTGSADILDEQKAGEVRNNSFTDVAEYEAKGYITDEYKEKQLYNSKYADFIERRDLDEVQIFFVPNYYCNFACSYCYQKGYSYDGGKLNYEIIDSFYSYVDAEFGNRKKYITIFGGEPLLPDDNSKKNMSYIIAEAKKRNIDIAVVTNGYNLIDYIDIIKQGNIREIQVTLDGIKAIHDRRRFLQNGDGTFERIVEGIDAALMKEFLPVNLRIVVDNDNFEGLAGLAEFAVEKGWTKKKIFKTQIGRNYELHSCSSNPDSLFTRLSLNEELYGLIKKNPAFLEFYKPQFSVIRHLRENGELPQPLFDDCPACKNEWAFDYQGKIYPCTATVGKADEEVGTFYPTVSKNTKLIEEWQSRDTVSISECKDCSLQFTCGGGCGSIAKNNTGSIKSKDCRPAKELIELGLSAYFDKEIE